MEKKLSFWGRSVFTKINEIIERFSAQIKNVVDVNVEFTENPIQVANLQDASENSALLPLIIKFVIVILPMFFVIVGNFLGLKVPVLAILAGFGGLLGSYIQTSLTPKNSGENVTYKLRPEDFKVKISLNKNKTEKLIAGMTEEIERLCAEISDFENTTKSKHNVALDRNFGSWIQRFLIFAEKFPEDRNIQRLREDLINNVLSGMRIHVADSENLKMNSNGKFNLPTQDYLIDSRNSKTEKYKVTRPVIYSDEQLLARGEIS